MKQNLEHHLETASTRMNSTGKKTMQKPIASILSLCVLAWVGATIISYSQTTNEEIEFTDVQGRKLKAIVISKNDTTVRIKRSSDGVEFDLPLENLSKKDREWLRGPLTEKKAPHNILVQENNEKGYCGETIIAAGTPMKVIRETEYGTIILYKGEEVWTPPATGNPHVRGSSIGPKPNKGLEAYPLTMLLQKNDPLLTKLKAQITKDDAIQAAKRGPRFVPRRKPPSIGKDWG